MQAKCSICLDQMKYPLGKPDTCEHKFCYACIDGWMKQRTKCPLCYRTTKYLIHIEESEKETKVAVRKRTATDFENEIIVQELIEGHYDEFPDETDDVTIAYARCRACKRSDNMHLLLLCDKIIGRNANGSAMRCNVAYHCYCLPEKLDHVPDSDWFCPFCTKNSENINDMERQTHPNTSNISANTNDAKESKEPSDSRQKTETCPNNNEGDDAGSEVKTTSSKFTVLDFGGCSNVGNNTSSSSHDISIRSEIDETGDDEDAEEAVDHERTRSSRSYPESMEEDNCDVADCSDSDKSVLKCSHLQSEFLDNSSKKKTNSDSGTTERIEKSYGQSTSKC